MKLLDGQNLDDIAIALLRQYEPQALELNPAGYWLAYSGGKDSDVILDLAKRSGIKFTAHYNMTTVDPPELVHYIRRQHPEVKIERHKSMWQLIREHHCPPRRAARFCCQELKECGGSGHIIITGIRNAESPRRAKRRQFEACYRDGRKFYLNPIKAWPTSAVWAYIRGRKLPYCRLYDEGFKRIGCVLCPMTRNVQEQIDRWPKLAAAWRRAIVSTFKPGYCGRTGKAFKSEEDYWQWWLDRDASIDDYSEPDDMVLFEDDPDQKEAVGNG